LFSTSENLTSNPNSKTVAPPQAPIDLQFFPEGGEWLIDMPTKIAFKALNNHGQGIPISGKIVDGKDSILNTFSSNHLGMGSIELIAKADHSYHAILDSTPNISIANKYPLPQSQLQGYTLRIQQRDENIVIFAYDQTGSADSLSVQISNRGVLQYLIKALPH